MDLDRILQLLEYHTSTFYWTRFWLKLKFRFECLFAFIPAKKKREKFNNYIKRLDIYQQKIVIKYHIDMHTNCIDRIEALGTEKIEVEGGYMTNTDYYDAKKDKKRLESYYEDLPKIYQKHTNQKKW
ncbi:MAG: hypothetical protein WD187_02470 [Candidatus Woykebacteria bacterium]